MLITIFFFLKDTAPPETYPLPLHAALPIPPRVPQPPAPADAVRSAQRAGQGLPALVHPGRVHAHRRRPLRRHDDQDRKSTRLNSSHANISYAVFCLKKKKNNKLSEQSEQVV